MNDYPANDAAEAQLPSLEFLLPFGEELAVLLRQPYVTVGALKQVLRGRGLHLLTNEKRDLIEPLVLGYLSPAEFDFLFSFAKKREESDKLRTYTYEVKSSGADLETALPSVPQGIADDPNGNFRVVGSPSFVREFKSGEETYVWKYRVRRLNITSDYLHTHQVFPAELRITRRAGAEKLIIQSFHTSEETETTNRSFQRAFVKALKRSKFIKDEETEVIRFNDFTNEERVRFFMEFTNFPNRSGLRFEEFVDFSVKVDPEAKIPDGISMTWMRERVSTLKIAGKGLHNVFLLSEIDCRPHIFLWRVEVKLIMETPDGDATAHAVLEFGGFGKAMKRNAIFQISVDSLRLKGCPVGSGAHHTLTRKLSIALNEHKEAAFAKVKGDLAGAAEGAK